MQKRPPSLRTQGGSYGGERSGGSGSGSAGGSATGGRSSGGGRQGSDSKLVQPTGLHMGAWAEDTLNVLYTILLG